jgi:glyoxylase-like metal-dependent hydrolase (beta-lactamase superfamily II)
MFFLKFQGIPFEIDDVIEVHPTPGHTLADVSVLVKNTEQGNVVISGEYCTADYNESRIQRTMRP